MQVEADRCAVIYYVVYVYILYISYVCSVRCNYYIQGLYVNVFLIEKEHASLHVSSRYIEGALLFHADSAMQLKILCRDTIVLYNRGSPFPRGLLVSILHTAGFSRGKY